MEVLFIEARLKNWKFTEEAKKELLDKLSQYKTIGLVATVQYIDVLKKIEKFLKEEAKTVKTKKSTKQGIHARYKGQVLGCDAEAANLKADIIIYIGDGMFHPIAILMETNLPVIGFNPKSGKINEITEQNVKIYRMRKALAFDKLKHSNNIGILVSIKPGQYQLKGALETKKKLEKKGKNALIFVFDELQIDSLINFPDIDSWINTACPRMAVEDAFRFRKSIINYNEIDWKKL